MHASGQEPKCTVCLQPWSSHPWGKHIPKDCKFWWQQAPGDSAADDLEQPDNGDIHTRLNCIMQQNQAIKAQLSQLTELVCQLLPQPGQASPQPVGDQGASASQETMQRASISSTAVSLPPPSWPGSEDWESTPGSLQLLSPSHTGQHPLQPQSSQLPTTPGTVAGQVSAIEASPHQLWHFPASTRVPMLPATKGLSPAQIPASIWGKIQQGEYVDLLELLAYDFQYRYSGLDNSQALEVVDGKLSLAPKCKVRHLSNLQLWLHAWHLYEDTVLSFFPHRYMELLHYRRHISDLVQHFHWASVLSYNAQFQHRCAVHGLPFSTFDQQLYVTTLDAIAAKATARRCFCQQFDHEVIDCPFPPGALLEKDLAAKKTAQSQQGWGTYQQQQQQQHSSSQGSSPQLPAVYHQGREICIKYQSGSCSFPNCRRAHVCRHCKQDHPATECHPAGPVTPQPR